MFPNMEHDSATSRSRPPRVVGASRCDGFFKLETPPVDTASGEKKKRPQKPESGAGKSIRSLNCSSCVSHPQLCSGSSSSVDVGRWFGCPSLCLTVRWRRQLIASAKALRLTIRAQCRIVYTYYGDACTARANMSTPRAEMRRQLLRCLCCWNGQCWQKSYRMLWSCHGIRAVQRTA